MKSRESTLLEREEPLRRLEAALGAARRGQGRILSVEGEAGIGKTTLTLSFAEAHRADAQVLIGGCEHLVTPEPLGPLRDIARESQGRFTVSSSGQLTTFESLLRLLTAGRDRPALLIIEDIHWADDSTLDLLRYLGRRIRSTPILAIVTFRNDEAASQSRLAALYADLPRDCCERLELLPLSAAAVSQLAGTRMSGGDVFEATGGNPFHVTEYLATPPPAVPHGVRDATLARASRLSALARRTLDCASIFPRQI
ncbi:MAG TPA: AAA family ATPase, partial [Steroidobacteraceae bacterium]|nr:AAA family ATPase [Steroidobacteraceae bacterium]